MRTVSSLRTVVQAASLAVFCLLLWFASQGSVWGLAAGSFLCLDPLSGLALPLAARTVLTALWPVLLVYVSAMLFGRVFCGWICPMGATLDALGWLVRMGRQRKQAGPFRLRPVKYLLLVALLLAAIFGVNLAFWASPLPLTARLYALVLFPLGEHGMEQALTSLAPLMEHLKVDALRYWQIETHTFATAWFVALFWGVCVALERVSPRFWCRYLCPAGALLGVLAHFAPWRRRVEAAACNS
ncbi:MAG: 4Fe-4S binding protein, partial [Desulfovibrio sp.]|nr:4Fe-4S binding protein [Desulfovibrio sp.]